MQLSWLSLLQELELLDHKEGSLLMVTVKMFYMEFHREDRDRGSSEKENTA